MTPRSKAGIVAVAIAGIAAGAGIGLLANEISGDSIGLSPEPLRAGDELAPISTTTREDEPEQTTTRNESTTTDETSTTTDETSTTSTTTGETSTTSDETSTIEDSGGSDDSGSDDSGSDDSGSDDSGSDD